MKLVVVVLAILTIVEAFALGAMIANRRHDLVDIQEAREVTSAIELQLGIIEARISALQKVHACEADELDQRIARVHVRTK